MMAPFFPNKGVAFVAIRKHYAANASPLRRTVVARRTAENHLLRSVVNAPISATHAVVARLEQMTMQSHHA